MVVRIRAMTGEDSGLFVRLCLAEGWVASEGWVRAHVGHDPAGCFVAEVDGAGAAVMTTTYYAISAWMGNLIVDRPFRGPSALGIRLFKHGLDHLRAAGARTVRSEAEPNAVDLNRRYGFVDEYPCLRLVHEGGAGEVDPEIEAFDSSGLSELLALDRDVFGDDRSRFLPLVADMADRRLLLRCNGQVAGYVMRLPSALQSCHLIGPCVTLDEQVARVLIQSVLAESSGWRIAVGVPEPNEAAARVYNDLGFQYLETTQRLYWGERLAVGRPSGIFALATGAAG